MITATRSGSPVTQDIGEAGEYCNKFQWQRLEYSRDRVFKLEWSVPMKIRASRLLWRCDAGK